MKKLLAILGVVVMSVGLVALGWFGHTYYVKNELKTASKQAEAFVQDVVTGDAAKAYTLTSDSMKDIQTEKQFIDAMKNLKTDKPDYGKATIVKAQDGTMVYVQTVAGLPKAANGSTSGQFTVMLVNKGGWKVNSSVVN